MIFVGKIKMSHRIFFALLLLMTVSAKSARWDWYFQNNLPASTFNSNSQADDMTDLQADLTELSHGITELQHDLTELPQGMIELSHDMTDLHHDLTQLSQDMIELSNDMFELQHKIQNPFPGHPTSPCYPPATNQVHTSINVVFHNLNHTQTTFTNPPVLPSKPVQEECGIRHRTATGTEDSTSPGEFRWMGIIVQVSTNADGTESKTFVCGATVLSPSILLTAAHCVEGQNIESLKVRVGDYEINSINSFYQEKNISIIHVHPNYGGKSIHLNDLAMLEVSEPFQMDPYVSPICTPFTKNVDGISKKYDPKRCLVTGWGMEHLGGSYSKVLKKVDLSIVPNAECENRINEALSRSDFKLHESSICAGGEPGIDACKGDGGGPLACELLDNPNQYVQVGVVSWGLGCGRAVPGVYASLESNMEWLSDELSAITNNAIHV